MAYFELKNSVLRGRRNVYGYILVGFSFLVLSLLTVKIFIPEVNTSAASQTAEQTVGPYKMSMSNDSVATVNIVPTSSQEVYKMTNNLSITNDCAAGATITMTTNSTTSNSLVRTAVNSDSLTKEIGPTTTSGLSNSSWGWSKDNGSTFAAVPKKGATAAVVYDEAVARTSAYTVPVMFGVKVDNTMPSGAYTNDVVYTMTPKQGCLTYAVVWDFDNGTKKSGATYPTSLGWGDTVNLSQLTPTRDGYTFAGWTSTPTGSSSGSSNYTGSETAANLNSGNAKSVTVKAKWTANCASGVTQQTINLNTNASTTIAYSGVAKCLFFSKDGNYKVELWGASGVAADVSTNTVVKSNNYSGYVEGVTYLSINTILYLYIGQTGYYNTDYTGSGNQSFKVYASTFNGGGGNSSTYGNGVAGGGATDIRTVSGSWDNENSLRSRVMVAGGSGGKQIYSTSCVDYAGATAGGLYGYSFPGTAVYSNKAGASGGSQISGGTAYTNVGGTKGNDGGFGYGGSGRGSNAYGAGGGGGWYGGGGGNDSCFGGGGGSSYISGHTGSVAVTSTSSSSPKSGCTTGTTDNACSITPYINPATNTGYTFTNTVMIDGVGYAWTNTKGSLQQMPNPSGGYYASGAGHSGNGYARITYLGA